MMEKGSVTCYDPNDPHVEPPLHSIRIKKVINYAAFKSLIKPHVSKVH